jgi:hypothetical protein
MLLIGWSSAAYAAEWTDIMGTITTGGGTPLCAMVLANGQYMFTCDPQGEYNLYVPFDESGRITLFGFCDGFMPFKTTLSSGGWFDIKMSPCEQSGTVSECSGVIECLELLKGNWTFCALGTDSYVLSDIASDDNGYYISGYDEYNNVAVGSYDEDSETWTLFASGSSLDYFYSFTTDGRHILSGCYYLIDKESGEWSDCYELFGRKSPSKRRSDTPNTPDVKNVKKWYPADTIHSDLLKKYHLLKEKLTERVYGR